MVNYLITAVATPIKTTGHTYRTQQRETSDTMRVLNTSHLTLGVIGLVGMAYALWKLREPTRSLHVEKIDLDGMPATIFSPHEQGSANPSSTSGNNPVVIIAHGFAGSQQIMYPFAVTLARNGYTTITFDFPGHGRNTMPLRGDLEDEVTRYGILRDALHTVTTYAQTHFGREIALLGHSMGSGAVTRFARDNPQFAAVAAISLIMGDVTHDKPRNLLVVNGALEAGLRPIAQKIMDNAAGGQGSPSVTYGSAADGTARRVVFAPSVEHIGVLFSRTTLAETVHWFNMCLNRASVSNPFIDSRLRWLGVAYLSAILSFVPFAAVFHRHSSNPEQESSLPSSPLSRAEWATLVLAPALLTPVLMRVIPLKSFNRIMPVLVGGPTAIFFGIYGLLTGAGLALTRARHSANYAIHPATLPALPDTLAMASLMGGYVALAHGIPTHQFVLNYIPVRQRLAVIAHIFIAMLPYFLADELLTRHPHAPRGAYALTKIGFVGSLGLAIALNPYQLFFLILAAPVFLSFFVMYGTCSGIVYRRSGTPLPGAVANAAIFALSIGTTFPLVERR